MLKQIKIGIILENAMRIAGFEPAAGISDCQRVLMAFAIRAGLEDIYSQKFPMLQRIELRQYRPTWTSTLGALMQAGQECWYADDYWRLTVDGQGDTEPSASNTSWRKLDMKDVVALIEFEQPWESYAMAAGGVDRKNFAFAEDPKYYPEATPIPITGWMGTGVILKAPAPKRVYVRFIPEPDRIECEEWSSENAYDKGDIVYLTASRECYKAITAVAKSGGSPDTATDEWTAVRVPEAFEEFLTLTAATALMTQDQGKYQSKAAADKELEKIIDRFTQDAGESRIRIGRIR